MKHTIFLGSVLCLVFVGMCGRSARSGASDDEAAKPAQKEPEERAQPPAGVRLMRAKLASSQDILEGLVTEDFDRISKGAMRLQVISALDEWRVSDDPLYSQYSAEFRRIASSLKDQARNRNTDGAALSYVELNLSCVRCHKFLREDRAEGETKPKVQPVP